MKCDAQHAMRKTFLFPIKEGALIEIWNGLKADARIRQDETGNLPLQTAWKKALYSFVPPPAG